MCLVCHKIMTQRKLDTIKRHTIRRHTELLSMSDEERQRLYSELASPLRLRHRDLCGNDLTSPLRATPMASGRVRHEASPRGVIPPKGRPRLPSDMQRPSIPSTSAGKPPQLNHFRMCPPMPSHGPIPPMFAKHLMGFQPPPVSGLTLILYKGFMCRSLLCVCNLVDPTNA